MNPSRILPDLQCSLVCEDVRQEINGNFVLCGVISLIRIPKVPVVAWRLFVFNRWTAGVGKFVEVVRLVGPDQATVLRKGQTQFALENPAQNMTNVTLFSQIQLTAPGVYSVEVLVDDVMRLRYPLPVLLAQPPAGAGSAPAGQAANPGPAPTSPAPDGGDGDSSTRPPEDAPPRS